MAVNTEIMPSRSRTGSQQRLAAFWRWWTGELRELIPERFSAMGGLARAPLVVLHNGEVSLLDTRGALTTATISMESLDAQGQRHAMRRLLESTGDTRARVRLCLMREEALVRRVTLPAATEENLEQVLGFEMDRLTPFRAEDVYFDHRIVARDAVAGQVQVQLAVARRDVVDAKVDQLRAWGASVQGVTVQDDAASQAPLDLLPLELRGQRDTGGGRFLVPGLVILVCSLLAVALLYPAYRKRDAVVALLPALAKARQEAEATDVVRTALERQVTDYNFLAARKQGTWPALAFVEEMSRLLPDNTWVNQMDVKTSGKTREIQVTGETASASRLIEIFEQSSVLQNATPKGAVTRGSTPGTERFMIVAEAKPRTVPPARPLVEVAEALPNIPPPAAAPPPQPAPAEVEAAPTTAPAPSGAPQKAPPPKSAPFTKGK
jgi:general secretion pathway protein L